MEESLGGRDKGKNRAFYNSVSSCVMVEGENTSWFETAIGVRQGCVCHQFCILFS